MDIRLATSDRDIERAADLLRQLRTHLDRATLIERIRTQQRDGYQLALLAPADGPAQCVAGFVITTKLAWGRALYVDDLVTDAATRSSGAGRRMLDWLKAYARAQACGELHLDSGVQRFEAHRFYLREGFRIASHHFALTLDAPP
ncbi:GNAT family N-acetyltransferase [Nitrogeniibacter mangrovi]|uniref:GNAT family N-acetyltransferase n=1 Tax=Nitrogeniibacter mangrovi TaxID=2016596 RepID=A0A6C1B8P6_9RHOO|nr:GNAT family N-acetyltransferase [Nitrogeniibacter mangrovi]QID18624.1 GNAT family N-acetyltransferase [Nitrogeniibacter mangrovi]